MIYYGKGGKQYNLPDKPLAAGGEGEIYNVNGQPALVAKIYKPNKLSPEKERKLISMVGFPPSQNILTQIAWPQDVLYDSVRKFTGFVMPKMAVNEDLNVIYEYGASSKYPDMPWENRIIIAENLCAVLDAIHNSGHVCGDLNPKNISVNPQNGFVVFLDTDSYHIQDGANTYRCDVGITEYLPAEVQRKMRGGNTLATASLPTFSQNTDNFALAIHIFQLLMNGVHPFACAIIPSHSSVTAPQPSDNIERGAFPFMQNIPGIKIPVYAPPINILPKNIQDLFKRAFIDGHGNPGARPQPAEWHTALDNLRRNLKNCNKVKHHQYHNSLSSCPWCDADKAFSQSLQKNSAVLQQISIKPSVSPPPPRPSPSMSSVTSLSSIPSLSSIQSQLTMYVVAFNNNGGSGFTPSAKVVQAGSGMNLPICGSLKSGYIFGGWNTNAAGTGTTYREGSYLTPPGNITLYAKWDSISGKTTTATRRHTAPPVPKKRWQAVAVILSLVFLGAVIAQFRNSDTINQTSTAQQPSRTQSPFETQQSAVAKTSHPVPDGFVLVNGGTFMMGSPANEPNRDINEGPQHKVTVSPFYMGKYEVTQREYEGVMGTNPSFNKGPNLPVYGMTWYDTIEFCNKLSMKEGLEPVYTISGRKPTTGYPITSLNVAANWSKNGYRLPTEAEWEYAARGGDGSPGNFRFAGSDDVNTIAWYEGNSGDTPHEVGTKESNALGIYDMSGNMHEWCWDRYKRYSFFRILQTNPKGPLIGTDRVFRGGDYHNEERSVRSTFRLGMVPFMTWGPTIGIRLVRGGL